MVRELFIRNFAIIDDLHICFSEGLTILSGETGAGKSIIINAVNLLLGSRADASFVRTGADTAELEVLFQIAPDSRVAEILKNHDYDSADGLVIRRIISRNSRHRTYVNGRIATIKILNSITENLASISGQHAHQLLLKEEHHLMIVDQFGGLISFREKVSRCFHEIFPLIQQLNDLKAVRDRQTEQMALLEFEKKDITEACVSCGEDSALERERMLLKNGETLYQAVYSGIEELYSAQNAIVERLVEVKKRLEGACEIDPDLSSNVRGLDDTTFQIEDIVEGLRTYLNNLQINEKRLEEVEERLDTLQRLKRKYGGSLEAVLSHLESVEHELSGIENLSDNITETEEKLSQLHDKLTGLASELSEKRKNTAKILSQKVEGELSTLNMSQTKFEIDIRPIPAAHDTDPYLRTEDNAITEIGMDKVSFLIAPNVGEYLKPLANIASGGELSRVVLALKAILAETESVETVIFDEVDAGIGGSTAEVVGKKLASLAAYHQVVCITHLPQIAKFGEHHLRISKHVSDGRTCTTIDPLDKKDRVQEIARMLGGVKMTQVTLDHALEMLQSR
ncbi:DNA repair protein RecN [Desulfonema magnum]|uniref:DNA repair protein RecN n=1 Tax=Desulfonema magnum TaxID=45655 RepID=A0A975GTJ1_9BACT|nr:DNA repair protein RecN [Desulfonema magnum]QTA92203.1 DNA repair protein [Desulfonema magnum]